MTPLHPTFHDCGTVYHTDLITLCGELARRGLRVDMILCDLPYGTTACAWDTVIPFDEMWTAFRRVIKPRGAIVLTASQPFTSALVMSNPKWFKHEWIWNKVKPGNVFIGEYCPLRNHESVLVFSVEATNYYPIMIAQPKRSYRAYSRTAIISGDLSGIDYERDTLYPKSIITFSNADQTDKQHPTQKPVSLFQYLIRTYTRPGEIVLDPTCGSGTTAIAAREEGRRFIVGDLSEEYIAVTRKRLNEPYTPSFMNLLQDVG